MESLNAPRRSLPGMQGSAQMLASRHARSIIAIDAHLESRSTIIARSTPSPGAIAGIVIGSVIGGSLILLVLGFLYFRVRRSRAAQRAEDDPLGQKSTETERRLSFPGPPTQQQPAAKPDAPRQQPVPSILKDGWADEGFPTPTGGSGAHQQSPTTANGGPFAVGTPDFYGQTQQPPIFGNDFDYPSSSQPFSYPDDEDAASPPPEAYTAAAMQGVAASYYDTTVNLDSDPEQAPGAPPSRQMTEIYEQQRKEARASRKSSKSSSRFRFFKRKRQSTRSSDVSLEAGLSQPPIAGYKIPVASIELPSERSSGQGASWNLGGSSQTPGPMYEEPQDMSEDVSSDQHADKKKRIHGLSGDQSGFVPQRLNSFQTESTQDPLLPSSAMRSRPVPSHQEPQERRSTRFKSPELPEPMELDSIGFADNIGPAVVRGSHSPPLGAESFVTPMDVMKPTNAMEKAAYNEAELVRIASASPPTSPPPNDIGSVSPPPQHLPMAFLEPPAPTDDEFEESEVSDYPASEDEGVIPVIEEPAYHEDLTHGEPSDYSSPAGQSSTNASSGRTPDTRITPTPSPVPSGDFLRPESNASPPDTSGSSPKSLTCEECGRTFDQIHKLNHHKRYHDRKHECPYPDCDKRFGTKTHLDRHINDKHEKKKGFHCTQEGCPFYKGGKQFPRKDNWRRHMQNKHGITPQFDPEPTAEVAA